MAAKKKPIEALDAAALGLDAGALAPKVRSRPWSCRRPARRCRMIEGDAAAQA